MPDPSPEDMLLAAAWLRQYDDGHEGGADTIRCAAVADWLEAQADAKELRRVAREIGVPVSSLRAFIC